MGLGTLLGTPPGLRPGLLSSVRYADCAKKENVVGSQHFVLGYFQSPPRGLHLVPRFEPESRGQECPRYASITRPGLLRMTEN